MGTTRGGEVDQGRGNTLYFPFFWLPDACFFACQAPMCLISYIFIRGTLMSVGDGKNVIYTVAQ